MDFRGARSLLVAMAALSLPARAIAQTPQEPTVEPEPAPPPPEGPPPADQPPAEVPPPVEAPPPPVEIPPPVPLPSNVPTTWGPTRADESLVAAAAPPAPAPRPKLSAAVGIGSSLDGVGFDNEDLHAIPSFFTTLGIGDGPVGFDISAFASQALGRHRDQDPIDRLSVDAFGVVRPGGWYRRGDRSFEMRVLHALAVELGLGFERDGRSSVSGAVSGTRFLVHTGARGDVPISPPNEPTELRLRLGVRRGLGLYTPKLYGTSVTDYTNVHDSAAELYVALVVVF